MSDAQNADFEPPLSACGNGSSLGDANGLIFAYSLRLSGRAAQKVPLIHRMGTAISDEI
ncbi:protein of unknown function [Hyphomicrobium sp. MC1]|nr:protein of unknown function [Hyphomicrobium sp. MC1]